MKNIDDKKVALITGANKGIGYEIANQLGQKGFHVVITARDEERGMNAARSLAKNGIEVAFLQMDVADSKRYD